MSDFRTPAKTMSFKDGSKHLYQMGVHFGDGEWWVNQIDLKKDGTPWNSTPVRAFPTQAKAKEFAIAECVDYQAD